MNIAEQKINFSNEELILTNQRVIYWKGQKALILSDLHLGKAAHFRKNGIALPIQISLKDLQILEALIIHYQVAQVIIVGDLIHSGSNKEVDLFKAFTSKLSKVKFILIKGNHDCFSDVKLMDIGISEVYKEWQLGNIHFTHQPNEKEVFKISGHFHPGVRIKMPTNKFMKFPCFVVTPQLLILPAFSQFTGLDTHSIPEKAICYAFHEEGIFKVKENTYK